MADEFKPGFSMEVNGQQSGKGSVPKRGKKVKEEIGIGLVILAILIIAGFGVYWYFFMPESAPADSFGASEVLVPDVISSDLESDVYAEVPAADSVVPDAGLVVPDILEEAYSNPFE